MFGLLARRTWPLALMVSTNQVPFRNSNSKRSGQSTGRLGFRADKVPSLHWSCKLLCLRRCVQTDLTLYGSFRFSTAQIMRAVLLAMATAATLLGLRDRMSANHGSNLSGSDLMDRIRDVMPKTSNRRMYWSPIFEMWPNRSFPPLDLLSGVSPSQAANSLPLLNCLPLPTVATIAEAVIGPTPGIVRSGTTRYSRLVICVIYRDRRKILECRNSN